MSAIKTISGRGMPLRGDDLDTDRIMPARFLRVVTFEGLEHHVFEDDRAANPAHPFNDPRYQGAALLVVNANFGCGSSREHAPQGLARHGIRAIVGESFSEIFLGNSAVLGIPCFTAEKAAIERLQTAIERNPELEIDANIETGVVSAGTLVIEAAVPPGLREAFLTDRWNPTSMLLEDFDRVRAVSRGLPYVSGFATPA
jgi:3-isopropylmalate/(R)-2-methylmalate dehydratase small subunit